MWVAPASERKKKSWGSLDWSVWIHCCGKWSSDLSIHTWSTMSVRDASCHLYLVPLYDRVEGRVSAWMQRGFSCHLSCESPKQLKEIESLGLVLNGKLCIGRSYQWFALKLGRALGEIPYGAYQEVGLFNVALVTWAVKSLHAGHGGDTSLRKVASPWRCSVRIEGYSWKTDKWSENSSVFKKSICTPTPSFEFSVAENSQGSETKGVSDCMFLQKNQTSCHSQTDNTGWCVGQGMLSFACPPQQHRGLCQVCGLGRAGGIWKTAAQSLAGLGDMCCVERLRKMGLFNLRYWETEWDEVGFFLILHDCSKRESKWAIPKAQCGLGKGCLPFTRICLRLIKGYGILF